MDGTPRGPVTQTGERVNVAQVHTGQVTDIQFAPDESYFITSSKDTTARVRGRWEVGSGEGKGKRAGGGGGGERGRGEGAHVASWPPHCVRS